jgi:hypothetical protein
MYLQLTAPTDCFCQQGCVHYRRTVSRQCFHIVLARGLYCEPGWRILVSLSFSGRKMQKFPSVIIYTVGSVSLMAFLAVRPHDDLVPAFENYIISNNPNGFQKIYNKEKLPWTVYVGVLGMAGALVFAR